MIAVTNEMRAQWQRARVLEFVELCAETGSMEPMRRLRDSIQDSQLRHDAVLYFSMVARETGK